MSERAWSYEFQGAFELLRDLLGDELLAFLVDAPSAEEDHPRMTRTVRKLASNLDLLERIDPLVPAALVRGRGPDGLPMAWGMRRANGGDVPEPHGTDELQDVLSLMARDIYPLLLESSASLLTVDIGLVMPPGDSSTTLDRVSKSHPSHEQAEELLAEEGLSGTDLIAASAFSVSRVSALASPSILLVTAARRLRHAHDPSATGLMDLVHEVLEQLRALGQGRRSLTPAYVGLTPFPIPPGHSIELPQGVLRAPTEGEKRFAPFLLQAEAVLQTETICESVEPGGDVATAAQAEGQTALMSKGRDLTVSAALASDEKAPYSCPAVAWIVAEDLGRGSGSYRPLHPERPPGRSEPLSDSDIEAFSRWAFLVDQVELKHVEIAIDRLLRAIWESESTDSLIDAVIAWENLVGTRTETSYRVTAALAVLCQDDPEKRLATRKRYADVYNARSRVVHGDAAPADLHEHRNLAVVTALEALRRLMSDRLDLLGLSSSGKRADRLLLGVE